MTSPIVSSDTLATCWSKVELSVKTETISYESCICSSKQVVLSKLHRFFNRNNLANLLFKVVYKIKIDKIRKAATTRNMNESSVNKKY